MKSHTLTHTPPRRRRTLALLIALLPAGCATPPASPSARSSKQPATLPALAPPSPSMRRVELMNLDRHLAASQSTTPTLDEFLARVADDLRLNHTWRLHQLVETFPDVALDVLRRADAAHAADPAHLALAAAYDALFVHTGAAYRWEQAMRWRAAAHAEADGALRRCDLLRDLIRGGRAAEVASLPTTGSDALPPPWRAEELRLRGIAWLLADQPAKAAATWTRAIQLAAPDDEAAVELRLLSSEAFRRCNRPADAATAWTAAANQALALRDPVLWQRLVEMRPASTDWPAAARIVENSPESRIGLWSLQRDDPSGALLAYTRVADHDTDPIRRDQARVAQARAMLLLHQPGPANTLLLSVIQAGHPPAVQQAQAILGTFKLQSGDLAAGLDLLRQAVTPPTEKTVAPWPGYPQALADLGLAYLMSNQPQPGLQCLHHAQEMFRAANDRGQLILSLQNEALYQDRLHDIPAAQRLRQQADALEQSAAVLPRN